MGVALPELRHPRENRPGAVEVTGVHLRKPHRHVCFQYRIRDPCFEIGVIGMLLEKSTGDHRRPRVVATRDRVSEVALRGIPQIGHNDQCDQDANDGRNPPPAAPRAFRVIAPVERGQLGQQQHGAAAPPIDRGRLFGCRGGRG
jgi:hypothetical protein